MSFSYRDKPRLSERLRGKSGDEILNELEQQFDQDRKMFFETNPNWGPTTVTGPFSRAGFPFDDDMMSRGRQDIRSHLDDLAQRHPEFADHLRCPPWGGEVEDTHTFRRKRRGSDSVDDDIQSQASASSSSNREPSVMQETEERGRGRPGNLNHHGLRNTVDLGQQQHQESEEKQGRGQRSMSAPPDNRSQQQPPQRYVSRIEINPVNPADPTSGGGPSMVTSDNHGKPPIAPKQQQTAPKQQQSGNVRHIPIFVEGRDEPLLPKINSEKVEQVFPEPPVEPGFSQMHHGFSRPGFGSQHQFFPHQQTQAPRGFQQHRMAPPSPKQQRQAKPSPSPPQQQQEKQQQQQEQQQKPKQPEAPPVLDPISRVQAVAKEVADLQSQVEKYTGESRNDKDYIYLDEMLTRNLLKLDDIDTEGKENVRQARKEVIKTIQRCISILESKVPNAEEENKVSENKSQEEDKTTEEDKSAEEPMVAEENKPTEEPMTTEEMVTEEKSTEPMETETAVVTVENIEDNDNVPKGSVEVHSDVKESPVEAKVESKPEGEKAEVDESEATEQVLMEVEESKQTEPAVTNAEDSTVAEEATANVQNDAPPPETKSS